MSELGLDRPVDLATELDLVGEDVKQILAEARAAAEKMRSRAAESVATGPAWGPVCRVGALPSQVSRPSTDT